MILAIYKSPGYFVSSLESTELKFLFREEVNKSTTSRGNIRPITVLQGYPMIIAGLRLKLCGLLCGLCYVAIVTSYGMKKDGLKKSQREVTHKLRKGEPSFSR